MIVATQSYAGLRELGIKIVHWRVGLKWYVLAYFGPALAYGLGVLIFAVLDPSLISDTRLSASTVWSLLLGADTGIW